MKLINTYARINNKYKLFINTLSTKPALTIVLVAALLTISNTIIFSQFLFPQENHTQNFDSKIEEFILSVLVLPFFETLLLQELVITNMLKKWPNSALSACILSMILFSMLHHYSWAYVIKTLMSGFVYASVYLTYINQKFKPLFIVTLIHTIHNGFGFVANNYLGL